MPETKHSMPMSPIVHPVPLKTRGNGDCAFHAALGEWNGNEVACLDIHHQRKIVADKIRDCKPGDNLFPFIKSAIEAMLMDGESGSIIKNLKKIYDKYLIENEVLVSLTWDNFEKELIKYPDILAYLNENATEKDKLDKPPNNKLIFSTCLNKNAGLLYALILSIPELNAAFLIYNQATNDGFKLESFLTPEIINDYAAYIEKTGNWLLPVELKLLAYAFEITVIFSLKNQLPGRNYVQVSIFNPGMASQIEVSFNGSNHYERMSSKISLTSMFFDMGLEEPELGKSTGKKAKDEKKLELNLKEITAMKLIMQIENLHTEFKNRLKSKKDVRELNETIKIIHYYFDRPHLVSKATCNGGIAAIKEKYAGLLLQVSLYITKIIHINNKQADHVNKSMSVIAQRYKIKRAYTELYKGKKFKKAELGDFDSAHPITQKNPVVTSSKKNIAQLKDDLKKMQGGDNLYNLRNDEIGLFKALLELPYRLQHATNYYYPTLNAGALDSYTEIQRREPSYLSTFSTKGNIDKLGNGGFIFFRCFVDPINSSKTRYGDTSLVFDLKLLRTCGWVSLHDQLNPFPSHSPNSRHFYWNKRLLRTSEAVAIENNTKDKALHDGLLYSYRTSPVFQYDKGSKDTQKSFGEAIKIVESKRSFLDEIFYGEDILPGIALSIIRELRHLEVCGFRGHFLHNFLLVTSQEKTKMLGELIKGFFRIEGKYPASLKIQLDFPRNIQFFKPIAKTDTVSASDCHFAVLNPDGDGRYSIDMSINHEALEIAKLRADEASVIDKLSLARRQRARYKDKARVEKYTHEISELEAKKKLVDEKLNHIANSRQQLINYFVKNCSAKVDHFEKVSLEKMQLIYDHYTELLAKKVITLEQLLTISAQKLLLTTDESIMELLASGRVTFYDLAHCSLDELAEFTRYDISKPILEQDMPFLDLLELYRKNPMHLKCLTCDDLAELVLEQAPDIDAIVMEYAQEAHVDFDEILNELGDTDAMLLRNRLGYYDDLSEGYEDDNGSDVDDEEEFNYSEGSLLN